MKIYDGKETSDVQAPTPERIKVGIAEYEVTADGATLTTSGLGSCVGVGLYDVEEKIGGLVHVMLPVADELNEGNPAKFADTGTELLLSEMEAIGSSRENIEARIAGGSNMLDFSDDGSGIGERNVEQVKRTLEAYDVPVVGEDTGGDYGRSLSLDGSTGELVVRSANHEDRVL